MVEPGLAETRVWWWSVIDPRACHIVQWFEMRGTGGRPTPRCAGCVLEECTSCGFHRARNGPGAPLGLRCWAPRQMNLHDTLPVLTYSNQTPCTPSITAVSQAYLPPQASYASQSPTVAHQSRKNKTHLCDTFLNPFCRLPEFHILRNPCLRSATPPS